MPLPPKGEVTCPLAPTAHARRSFDASLLNSDLHAAVASDHPRHAGGTGRCLAARHVSTGDALGYVFGYTACNDVSARDAQFADGQWIRGKSFDTFCPLGPWIVTADEIPDPQSLAVRCYVNGTVLQDGTTREMVFSVAELVSYLSRVMTLEPGDVIATGTPYGVGFARQPPVYLLQDDVVEIEIEGIGRLRNRVVVD